MKLKKFLLPIVSIGCIAATVTPLITSCSSGVTITWTKTNLDEMYESQCAPLPAGTMNSVQAVFKFWESSHEDKKILANELMLYFDAEIGIHYSKTTTKISVSEIERIPTKSTQNLGSLAQVLLTFKVEFSMGDPTQKASVESIEFVKVPFGLAYNTIENMHEWDVSCAFWDEGASLVKQFKDWSITFKDFNSSNYVRMTCDDSPSVVASFLPTVFGTEFIVSNFFKNTTITEN